MTKKVDFVGAILAGGQGLRLGGQKALMQLGGQALVIYAAKALTGSKKLCVVGDAAAAGLVDAEFVNDNPDLPAGPLRGVLAALTWADLMGSPLVVTIPCDTPFLPLDCAQTLIAALQDSEASVISCKSSHGIEPLVCAWRVKPILPAVKAALSNGQHPPIHCFLRDQGAQFKTFSDAEMLNINTPEALADGENLLAGRRTDPAL